MPNLVKDSLTSLKTFIQDHEASFTNGMLILFTVGGEQIFKVTSFDCPCKHPEARDYALTFVLAPFFVLLFIGIAVSNLTWRLCHGSGKRKQGNGFRNVGIQLCSVGARSAVVPFSWIFMAGVDGNYFACMLSDMPCNKTTSEYLHIKSMSQMCSWITLAVGILIILIVICVVRCRDSVTYEQSKYIHAYRTAEQNKLDEQILKKAEKLAQDNVEEFMKEERVKYLWDKISKVPEKKIQEDEKEMFLSYLNEWALSQPVTPKQQTPDPTTQQSPDPTTQQPPNPTTQQTSHPEQKNSHIAELPV